MVVVVVLSLKWRTRTVIIRPQNYIGTSLCAELIVSSRVQWTHFDVQIYVLVIVDLLCNPSWILMWGFILFFFVFCCILVQLVLNVIAAALINARWVQHWYWYHFDKLNSRRVLVNQNINVYYIRVSLYFTIRVLFFCNVIYNKSHWHFFKYIFWL